VAPDQPVAQLGVQVRRGLAEGMGVVVETSPSRAERVWHEISSAADGVAGALVVGRADRSDAGRFERRACRAGAPPFASVDVVGEQAVVLAAAPAHRAGRGAEAVGALPPGLLGALVERGVPASTVAAALAAQPGWTRNAAYRAVHRGGGGDAPDLGAPGEQPDELPGEQPGGSPRRAARG
jgi:hypothetical protein